MSTKPRGDEPSDSARGGADSHGADTTAHSRTGDADACTPRRSALANLRSSVAAVAAVAVVSVMGRPFVRG
ncbi:hypothetical protein ABT071_36695, partial [Streptomyces sp. NPDC002506]|uniref:hypothetical protein n=1 Tax=Streptomyces sp. NPDC002506 TaxID=3154536 RepID=UPI003317EB32